MTVKAEIHNLINTIKASLGYGEINDAKEISGMPFTIFEDMDGKKNLVVISKDYTNEEAFEIFDGVYSTVFGSGSMCATRSNKWNEKVCELNLVSSIEITEGVRCFISPLTVLSFLMFYSPRLRDTYNSFSIMSKFTHWLDNK